LVNLTGNALKFTSSGTISITVQKEKEIDELVFIHFSVKDTGIGIPKSKIDSVFERFHQGDEDTTRKYGGTGLGLAIVKQLVDIQGGTISVKSEEGKGSEFSFTIPYKIVKDGHHLINLPFNENQEETFIDYPITILVVEDNVMNQNLIKYLFTDWGIHFTISPNGALAIEELKKHSFDLILMDIQMPEMNGYTATQIIREQLHLDTPIVAMTAHAMAGEREKCLSYGMNDYISKPVKEKELYKIIRNLTTNNFIQNNIFSEHQPVEKENNFEIIDIRYLQEITGQRSASQVVLTKQFIEHIPTEVADLENCLKESNYLKAKQVAHNLKTSISIMGLTSKLNEALDYIENHVIQEERSIIIESYFAIIKSVCKKAVDEAKSFLSHLQQSHPSES
jgi:CheY-like chemotaxis protein